MEINASLLNSFNTLCMIITLSMCRCTRKMFEGSNFWFKESQKMELILDMPPITTWFLIHLKRDYLGVENNQMVGKRKLCFRHLDPDGMIKTAPALPGLFVNHHIKSSQQ